MMQLVQLPKGAHNLTLLLLDETVGRYGQGNWTWQVTADQADPDLIDEFDPDEGNDWVLEVEFVILTPRITEVV